MIKAPAKINLFLEVGNILPNGYHNIESVMQSVTLYDKLGITKTNCEMSMTCNLKNLVYADNLVLRAANAFYEITGISHGASVYLEKHIPISAGLAGGSTDAAATLLSLNEMYGNPLTETQLLAVGKSIGADVPFCIIRGTCHAKGIGDMLSLLPPMPPCHIVIAKGNSTVSTKHAYEMLDAAGTRDTKNAESLIKALENGDLHGIAAELYNAFELIGYPDVKIKDVLMSHGALNCLMSGSGPSVFGIFDNYKNAYDATMSLRRRGFFAYSCKPEGKNIQNH